VKTYQRYAENKQAYKKDNPQGWWNGSSGRESA
jgi:hypothetical protein